MTAETSGGMARLDSAGLDLLRERLKGYAFKQEPEREGWARGAVLVPLYIVDGTPHVILTQRTSRVEHHQGQVSFPGGMCEPADPDHIATALRESFEEIGLAADHVEVLGQI